MIVIISFSSLVINEYKNIDYKVVDIEAEIVDKFYQSSEVYSISGVDHAARLLVGGRSYLNEKWVIVYKELKGGNIMSKEVEPRYYDEHDIGDIIVIGQKKLPIINEYKN